MTQLLNDMAFVVRILIVAICLYGFALFSIEWIRLRKASEIFAYITALFAALAFEHASGAYARIIRVLYGETSYLDYTDNIMWASRLLPSLFVLLILVSSMTTRLLIKRDENADRRNKTRGRRSDD